MEFFFYEVHYFLVFLLKHGAGDIDEDPVLLKMGNGIGNNLHLPVCIFTGHFPRKEIQLFGCAAPGSAAGAGGVADDELEVWGLKFEV